MDRRRASSCYCSLLFLLSILSLHSKVTVGDSAVILVHSPTRQYVRQPSPEVDSLSSSEVGALASVLLGFPPTSSLSSASSSKLNKVLVPNPFDRPRALFILEVAGAAGFSLSTSIAQSPFNNDVTIKVEGNERVEIRLPDEDEMYTFSLNGLESSTELSDNEISDFASWFGGSYVDDASRALSGRLIIPTASGASLKLYMTEDADRKFTIDLASLVNSIRDAKDTHQLLTKSGNNPAELIIGRFDGIKALQDRYGKEGTAESGLDVFASAITKAFNSLESSYEGKIVGMIGYSGPETENMFHVTVKTGSSIRALGEAETETAPGPSEIAELYFVRSTLAWITGIILLIATLLGVHFLVKMPLTKDTLLYSNVKLD